MDSRTQAANRPKKVAAALAAVELLLQEEARAAATKIAAPNAATSMWGLAGRLALMNGRLTGGFRGRG